MFKRLWRDCCGAVVSPEIAVVGAILIIGVIVGLSALKVALITEVRDVSEAVHEIDFTPTVTTGIEQSHPHSHGDDPPHTHPHTGPHSH